MFADVGCLGLLTRLLGVQNGLYLSKGTIDLYIAIAMMARSQPAQVPVGDLRLDCLLFITYQVQLSTVRTDCRNRPFSL